MKPFWNKRTLKRLETLKGTHTNPELAEMFDTTRRHIVYSLQHFGLKRTKAETARVATKRSQKGSANGNWRGGVSKDHYHYKKLQRQRYPEKIKARAKVSNEIRSGRMVRGKCSYCETDQNICAHITDYENAVESVVWACRKCNREKHHGGRY